MSDNKSLKARIEAADGGNDAWYDLVEAGPAIDCRGLPNGAAWQWRVTAPFSRFLSDLHGYGDEERELDIEQTEGSWTVTAVEVDGVVTEAVPLPRHLPGAGAKALLGFQLDHGVPSRSLDRPAPIRYYSTQRPIGPGTYPKPKGNEVVGAVNYDDRIDVAGEGFEAWGFVAYEHPLPTAAAERYGLVRETDPHELLAVACGRDFTVAERGELNKLANAQGGVRLVETSVTVRWRDGKDYALHKSAAGANDPRLEALKAILPNEWVPVREGRDAARGAETAREQQPRSLAGAIGAARESSRTAPPRRTRAEQQER